MEAVLPIPFHPNHLIPYLHVHRFDLEDVSPYLTMNLLLQDHKVEVEEVAMMVQEVEPMVGEESLWLIQF